MILAAAVIVVCMTAEDRERARAIMLEGIEAGLKQQVVHLFENRLKDRDPSPDRITRGVREAIGAYVRSREQVLKWSPPLCKG